ncbi:MAG: MFS transporter [Armatimonadetes bacterium]|nr:MFS transporter [Armatimonadota bacterium]
MPPAGPALFHDRLSWYLGISAYWFATSFKWFLLFFLLPYQLLGIVPGGEKNSYWGLVVAVGAVEAMVGPALFGYMSDRCRSRFGRRSPFIAIGAALTALALLFLGSAGQFWMVVLGYLFLQISDDVATGPYAALVPDRVPEANRGRASGVMGFLQQVAQIAAAVVGLALSQNIFLVYAIIAVINLVCAVIVILTVREGQVERPASPSARYAGGEEESVARRRGFLERCARGARQWISPWRSADFRWVWFTRFLNALGFYIIQFYLVYYLTDNVREFRLLGRPLQDAFQASVVLALLISLAGAVSALVGGRLADRIGRKRVVVYAGCLMFVTLIPFSLIPNYTVTLLLAPIFGAGYGAYLSATWALAADILPNPEDAAKDMGIWQMSVATPQVLTGFVGGLIDLGNRIQPGRGYTLAFFLASFAFLAGALMIRRVKGST